jgi:hypothetical protein
MLARSSSIMVAVLAGAFALTGCGKHGSGAKGALDGGDTSFDGGAAVDGGRTSDAGGGPGPDGRASNGGAQDGQSSGDGASSAGDVPAGSGDGGDDGAVDVPVAVDDGGPGGGGEAGLAGADAVAGNGGTADAAPIACLPSGAICVTNQGCCSNLCDPSSGTCKSAISTCSPTGTACSVPTDCCGLSCVSGKCGAAACIADGQACTSGAACCGGTCTGGVCQALNGSCKSAGNPCAASGECCSRLCQSGKCALGASYCIQPGDVCFRSTDCCTGLCQKAQGATAGVCAAVATTGSGNCTQDGVACDGCTSCCSRQCAPYALSGVRICQPASGCRLTNSLCQKNTDCCGGDPTASTENPGNVTCELDPAVSPALGTCRNPQGCQARGNVCGRKDGSNLCGGNAREDCCDCLPPKFNCCKADLGGIFRCFGGSKKGCENGYDSKDPNCCIAAGERCQFSSECCGGTPCTPDSQGVLRCLAKPPGGTACINTSGACTTTADCCRGLTCNITPGQTFGSCAAPPPPPPPPSPDAGNLPDAGPNPAGDGGSATDDGPGTPPADAGTTSEDAAVSLDTAPPPPPPPPVCGFYGQSCATDSPCCLGLTCVQPGTASACPAGASCVCTEIIQ